MGTIFSPNKHKLHTVKVNQIMYIILLMVLYFIIVTVTFTHTEWTLQSLIDTKYLILNNKLI